jgi:hypothetical protein
MLSSVEGDGLGEELQVIWEIEPGARVIEKVALPEPSGFDPPDKLDTFLDAVRWGVAAFGNHRLVGLNTGWKLLRVWVQGDEGCVEFEPFR